jgi:hypothetical protein
MPGCGFTGKLYASRVTTCCHTVEDFLQSFQRVLMLSPFVTITSVHGFIPVDVLEVSGALQGGIPQKRKFRVR